MNILVANLGSTSFKFRLFRFADGAETLVAKGGYERVTDFGRAIEDCLASLQSAGHLRSAKDVHAVGFKAVHGGEVTGCLTADEKVEAALMAAADLAPAHNPVYAAGIRQFRQKLPGVPLVALFETAFYQWVADPARRYAVPEAWFQAGVRRYGFHGASHRAASERAQAVLGRRDLRHVSCHLGGSSSLAAIRSGVAIDTSFGLSPQSGLPQNNRVGDIDAFAVLYVMKKLGLSPDEMARRLANESGLAGIGGGSGDVRDLEAAAAAGDRSARLALDVFVQAVRHYVGAFLVKLGGIDVLTFSGGIGENSPAVRAAVCAGLEGLGIRLEPERNATAKGEGALSRPGESVSILLVPADEERIVARAVAEVVSSLR